MQCEKCQSFVPIQNTGTTGQGLCSFVPSYFPVHKSDKCHLLPDALKCKDCNRFDTDTACFTCSPDDSAYHNGVLCSGFIDKNETLIMNALMIMKMRGIDYHAATAKLLQIVDEATVPGQPHENK